MPTILSHAAVPLALGLGLGARVVSRRLLVAGIIASVLPDFDVLAFHFHVAYSDALGHRGISHSIVFAILVALVTLLLASRLNTTRKTAFLFVAICAVSHGVLDMFTNGGLGVALLWPWSTERFFAPWQVIEVSPLGIQRVFSQRGIAVLVSELLWVWLPATITCAVLSLMRVFVSRTLEKRKSVDKQLRER
ncbi:metal-dependent hydrolase [Collimonas silvisoli]|uniref:metal-dependent hydrolase n=1 Tax=Collimonas silvisoli TaxID=2825884 RepID=UPI001B8AEC52|nr:metal-dependent hydrolase [Collimonas silvisoli]